MSTRKLDLSVGVLSVIPALVITFVSMHSLGLGLLTFGLWALVAGVTASQLLRRSGGSAWRPAWQLTEVVGLAAIVLWAFGLTWTFNWVSGLWAVGFAASTLARGGRSLRFIGVITALLGVAQLAMPVNPVVNVGVLGAYFVVLGVWLIIGALSPQNPAATLENEGAPTNHA